MSYPAVPLEYMDNVCLLALLLMLVLMVVADGRPVVDTFFMLPVRVLNDADNRILEDFLGTKVKAEDESKVIVNGFMQNRIVWKMNGFVFDCNCRKEGRCMI